MKEKKNYEIKKKFFPSYLLNQKIQGRGTANKQFFKDGFSPTYFLDAEFIITSLQCIIKFIRPTIIIVLAAALLWW